MKKMFKLLMCAAIVAAGFTACSEEVTPIIPDDTPVDGPNKVKDGTPTHASFSFSVPQANTKGLSLDASENTTITEFRVLIFDNATGALEVDTARTIASTDTVITIPLISGTKKIFVFANGGLGTAVSLTTPAKAATFNNLSQLNDEYLLGTGTAPYTNLPNMHALYTGGKFFYSSTVLEAVQPVQPSIPADESKLATNANRFYIQVDRPVAKLGVRQSVGSTITTLDGKGAITAGSIQYKVWNVHTKMFPFQNYNASGILTTPEPSAPFTTNAAAGYLYAREQGNSTDGFIQIPFNSSTPTTGYYYYVSENNPVTKMKGNTTIANIEAVYLPKAPYYSDATVGYNEATGAFNPVAATGDLGTPSDMYLFLGKGYTGIAENTLFASGTAGQAELLAKKVYYHIKNSSVAQKGTLSEYGTLVDLSIPATKAEFDLLFSKYILGKAYYGFPIGKQSGASVDYTVRRNWWYDCNITGFLKLGDNEPGKLVEPEDEVVTGPTNLSVTIVIRNWTGETISQNI
jgi:hypothetical protein